MNAGAEGGHRECFGPALDDQNDREYVLEAAGAGCDAERRVGVAFVASKDEDVRLNRAADGAHLAERRRFLATEARGDDCGTHHPSARVTRINKQNGRVPHTN